MVSRSREHGRSLPNQGKRIRAHGEQLRSLCGGERQIFHTHFIPIKAVFDHLTHVDQIVNVRTALLGNRQDRLDVKAIVWIELVERVIRQILIAQLSSHDAVFFK